MTRCHCACGEPAIGVVIKGGDSVLVCRDCYRAECIEAVRCP